jgi:hypothetical protein
MRVLRSNPRFAVVARQRHSWSEPLPTPSMPSNDSPITAGRPMVALRNGACRSTSYWQACSKPVSSTRSTFSNSCFRERRRWKSYLGWRGAWRPAKPSREVLVNHDSKLNHTVSDLSDTQNPGHDDRRPPKDDTDFSHSNWTQPGSKSGRS